MNYISEAMKMRPLIEKDVQSLPKDEALQAKNLHPKWSDLVKKGKVDTDGKPGLRFWYEVDNELYSCVNGDPEFQSDWIPGKGTGALYVRVNEDNAGTVDDPIPAELGRTYTETDEPVDVVELSETEEKARAYDILTGVSG